MDVHQVIEELRLFDARREVVQALQHTMPLAAPPWETESKARAIAILPHRNGLNRWVAASNYSHRTTSGGRVVTVHLKVSKSGHDLKEIDSGTVHAPAWGHRPIHSERVAGGFFTGTPVEVFRAAVLAALDEAAL